ncbi:MAG: TIGR00725 family protein [bacterium]|nr:TIGR00725 family protein [bacterium]
MQIGVIGESQPSLEGKKLAFEVGVEIAKAKAILICGGLSGVMEEASRGAKSQGGLTVGILPGTDKATANPYIDIPIVTGLDQARNIIIIRSSQAVIAIEGSYGTLSEMAFCLKLGVPLIGLKTWKLNRENHEIPPIIYAQTAKEAVEIAISKGKKVEND